MPTAHLDTVARESNMFNSSRIAAVAIIAIESLKCCSNTARNILYPMLHTIRRAQPITELIKLH